MPTLDPTKSAFLVLSYTQESMAGYPDAGELIARAARLLDAARASGAPVIHGVVQFRPGYPEVGPRSVFNSLKKVGRSKREAPEAGPHPALKPQPSDIILEKRRAGGFVGTDLELILRSHGRTTLVLLGVRTSGAILRTFCAAVDADYEVVVVSDCCADVDQELHRVLLKNLYGSQAVMTAQECIAALGKGSAS